VDPVLIAYTGSWI